MTNEIERVGPAPLVESGPPPLPEAVEAALIEGNLTPLSVPHRIAYYKAVCQSVGLNPLTQPFGYIVLNGKLQLYTLKTCTEQLRALRGISVESLEMDSPEADLLRATVTVTDKTGRRDKSTGVVSLAGLRGVDRANAYMKCETKGKRRATLSISGMGYLDESELDGVPHARVVREDWTPGKEAPAAGLEGVKARARAALPAPSPQVTPPPVAQEAICGPIAPAPTPGPTPGPIAPVAGAQVAPAAPESAAWVPIQAPAPVSPTSADPESALIDAQAGAFDAALGAGLSESSAQAAIAKIGDNIAELGAQAAQWRKAARPPAGATPPAPAAQPAASVPAAAPNRSVVHTGTLESLKSGDGWPNVGFVLGALNVGKKFPVYFCFRATGPEDHKQNLARVPTVGETLTLRGHMEPGKEGGKIDRKTGKPYENFVATWIDGLMAAEVGAIQGL